MNKVTTINLNGRAYQIEDAGYEALRKYLDQAAAKLHDNPDKDEIMADFETAVADKCDAHLSSRKNVITTTEIEAIIKAMGPVEAEGGHDGKGNEKTEGGTSESAGASASSPKKLYRIRQGEWIAGVCTGLAAFFGLDVTLVRVIFVLLVLFTHFFFVSAYIILWIVMPVAKTEDEKARAYGVPPFRASDFIEQAKARYSEFQKNHQEMPPAPENPLDKESWKAWKEKMKDWKHEEKAAWRAERDRQREERRAARHDWRNHGWQNQPWQNRPWQDDPNMNAGMGFLRFVMGLLLAALFVLWALAIWTIARHGMIFGIAFATGHSIWIPIIFVCALFYVIALPVKLLMKNASPWHWGRYSFFNDFMQSIFFLAALYFLVYAGRELFPIVNDAYGMVVAYLHTVRI